MRRLIPFRKQTKLPLYLLEEEQLGLRAACSFNASVLDFLRDHIRAGVTTNELDRLAETYTRDHGHQPACFGYNGYPKSICTSVNDVVCHGIPDDRELQEGDIVNVDCTTIVDGWYGDSSETFLIEPVSREARQLVQVAFDAMWEGIRAIQPYSSVFDIGVAISRFGRVHGYGVVENFQGHGIGRMFHQDPGIPHVPIRRNRRDLLVPGVSFTIEPMLNMRSEKTQGPLADGWTILTLDGSLSAQFEHQILMTEEGPEVLTRTQRGPQPGHVF
ncbi:type I methionyl aminopeptidase [Planctomicrobium sp. SH661]|uniref:type I methionyl aminopeptidase n=1 Tax=Planctomicrobium sp. SH661 TaxID=3448124 RepID=UPI003F5BE469